MGVGFPFTRQKNRAVSPLITFTLLGGSIIFAGPEMYKHKYDKL